MSITLLDADNKPIDVPEEHVAAAISSGQYAAPGGADQQIPVTIGGKLGTVPVSRLTEAIAKHGATVSSQAELQAAAKRKADAAAAAAHTEEYGGLGGKAASAAGGAIDTATFGLANELLPDSAKSFVRESEQENPGWKHVGQGLGLAVPLAADILTAGTATPELAAAEAGVAGATEGASLLGGAARATGKALAAPSRALSAVGDVAGGLTEKALQKLVGGEATSTAGRLISTGVIGAARGSAEGALVGVAQTAGDEALQENPDLTAEKLLHGGLLGAVLGGVGGGVLGLGGELGSKFLGDSSRGLSRAAEDQTAKTFLESSSSKLAKSMDELDGGVRGVSRQLLDDGLLQAGDTPAHIAPRITAAREAAQAEVDRLQTSITGEAPEAAAEVVPKTIDDARVYMATPEGAEQLRSLIKADAAASRFGADSTLGKLGKGEVPEGLFQTEAPVAKALADADPKLVADLDAAKLKLDRLTLASQAIDAHVEKLASRSGSVFSPLAALAGHAMGGLHGGPVGIAAGLASGIGKRALQERGSATAAVVLDKLATTQALGRISAQGDKAVTRIVQGAVMGTDHPPYKHRIATPAGYDAKVDMVMRAAANPDGLLDRVQSSVAPIATNHPSVAHAVTTKAVGAIAYLAQQIPPTEHPNPNSLTPQLEKREVPPEQRDKFERQVDATYNPIGTLAKLKNGTMTADERDTIEATHPELYAKTCDELKRTLSEATTAPSYQRETTIRMFLKLPQVSPALAGVLTAAELPRSMPGQAGGNGKTGGKHGAAPKTIKTRFSESFALK